MESYLKLIKESNLSPNFWCSYDYLKLIEAKEKSRDDIVWIEDSEGFVLFPPISNKYKVPVPINKDVWATFSNINPFIVCNIEFLDYEFIYRPSDFIEMKGGKWQKFRKNSRKWERNIYPLTAEYFPITGNFYNNAIQEVLIEWLDVKGRHMEIQDGDALIKAAMKYRHRSILYSRKCDKVWGINIFDFSHKRINFRWTISCPDEPYLDEYMRLLFYQNCKKSWLVNDGGCLGNENLKRFKISLNPIQINKIYSWRIN